MSLKITEDTMTVVLDGKVIAFGTRTGTGWHLTPWPTPLDRNAAITALSLAERSSPTARTTRA